MASLVGKVLFAAPTMQDPNFARTAVLLVQHVVMHDGAGDGVWSLDDEEVPGALGLVLNRGSGARVAEVLRQADAVDDEPVVCAVDAELFHGGPCDGPLMVLHGGFKAQPGDTRVMPGLSFSSDRDAIRPVLSGEIGPARFFAGYAGWGPGQLETELAEGAWVVGTLPAEVVLDADQDPWARLLGGPPKPAALDGVNPDILPRDPSMN